MKKINTIAIVCILLLHCGCDDDKPQGKGTPQPQFLNDTFDFKKIKKGDTVDVSFAMKNVGTADVLIRGSSVGCGCTKVKSIKETIAPGETMDLKLIYDSKADSGNILKTIVIETNSTPKLHVLYIKGFVE